MKIKTKKQLTLPQLIEWAWDNDVKRKAFHSNVTGGSVYFDEECFVYVEHEADKSDLFTVEVEEEITEDTVIDELVELYEDTLTSNEGSKEILINENISIRRAKDEDECPSRAFYIINDDLTLDLIWRDGKMVE